MAVQHADSPRGFVHLRRKRIFVATNTFCYHDTGIVAGLNDDAPDQVGYFDLGVHADEHF